MEPWNGKEVDMCLLEWDLLAKRAGAHHSMGERVAGFGATKMVHFTAIVGPNTKCRQHPP